MATLEKVNIIEWMNKLKNLITAYKKDVDYDIEKLNEIECGNLPKNHVLWGSIRTTGSEFGNEQRVFYHWGNVIFYYKLENLYKDGIIYGDITVYCKDAKEVQPYLKKYNV